MNRLINNIRSLFAAIVLSIVSFVRRTFLFNKLCHKFESRKPGFRRELHDVIKAIKEIYKTTPQPLTQLDHLRIYRLAEAFYVKYHEFDRPDFAYKFSPFHIMHAYCALPDFQEVIDVYKESTTLEEAQHDIGARMILFDAPLSMFKYHVMQVLYHMPSKQVVRVYGLRLMEEFMIDENHTEQVPGYLVKPLHSNNRCFMTVEDRLVVWNHCKMCLRAGLDLCKDPDPYRNDVVCGDFVKANENKFNLVYLHARLGAYRYYEDAQKARENFIIMNSEIAEDDIRIVAISYPNKLIADSEDKDGRITHGIVLETCETEAELMVHYEWYIKHYDEHTYYNLEPIVAEEYKEFETEDEKNWCDNCAKHKQCPFAGHPNYNGKTCIG